MEIMPGTVVLFSVKPSIFYFICLACSVGVSFGLWNNLQMGLWIPAANAGLVLVCIIGVFILYRLGKVSPIWAIGVPIFAVAFNFMVGVLGSLGREDIGSFYYFFASTMCLGLLSLSGFLLPSLACFILAGFLSIFVVVAGLMTEVTPHRGFIFSYISIIWGVGLMAYLSRRNLGRVVSDLDFHRRKAEDTLKDLQVSQKQVLLHEKIMSMGLVTSGVAHELKNPLNLIHNFTDSSLELLDDFLEGIPGPQVDSEKTTEFLQELRTNLRDILYQCERSDYIVHNMILRSRYETVPFETVDINLFVEESAAVAWFGFRANHQDKVCHWAVEKSPEAIILRARRGDLARAFLNILKNAFQAAVQNVQGGQVSIKVCREGAVCLVTIRDNGPGIPLDLQDKVFLPFFTTRGPREGLGLGLSTAYDIVTNCHQGRLVLESRTGESPGTEVRAYLPLDLKEGA